MLEKELSKKAFLQQYILTRSSHKRSIDDLLAEALKAYDFIQGA